MYDFEIAFYLYKISRLLEIFENNKYRAAAYFKAAMAVDSYSKFIGKILQFPALTLCNSANGGKALIFRRFRHLPFGRVIRISRRIPA